jgi:tetratricopeptide (TPR) repeat protein
MNRAQYSDLYAQKLAAARTAYFRVITSSDHAADIAAHKALAELEDAYPDDPTAEAYHGSLELLDAAHNWQIWNLHRQATDGLSRLDDAIQHAPDDPEARFIRAATSWHLPAFYHRRQQCEEDFAWLAQRAQSDAHSGKLPPELAAASMNYWGQILVLRKDFSSAKSAFLQAIQISPQSPGAQDAARRLRNLP